MQIYFNFPSGWYIILAFSFLIWLCVFIYRKGYKNKKEIKKQIVVAIISVIISTIIEIIGISTGLWNYAPGNLPIILWPTYFIVGLAGYQVIKLVEEYFG
jgi:fatty acid desaturase